MQVGEYISPPLSKKVNYAKLIDHVWLCANSLMRH